MARKTWRCFHCDDQFDDPRAARIHFGATESETPACKLRGGSDHHLIRHIRSLEDELQSYRSESDRITLAWLAMKSDESTNQRQQIDLEYNKGVRDAYRQIEGRLNHEENGDW